MAAELVKRVVLVTFVALTGFSAGWAQPANEITMQQTGDRFVTLRDFPDGGLTAGPRDVHVFLPQGYAEAKETYRVIYFNDGEGVFGGREGTRGVRADADYTLDTLVRESLVYPAILVAVANAKGVRNGRGVDLVPRLTPESAGRADEYYSFLAKQLKPYVDSHFRTKTEARHTGIAGYSLGGLAAFYFGYYHPDTFGMAACMAPSLWVADSKLLRDVPADGREKHANRFWIDAGERDAADIEKVAPRMAKILLDKGWHEGDDVAFQLGYGHTHSGTAMRERLRNALYFLLRKEAPAVRTLALKALADSSADTLDLATAGDRAYVWPEVGYEHGFYLNSVAIPLRIDNRAVATVDNSDVGRIRAIATGTALLTAELPGIKARLPVRGYRPGAYSAIPVSAILRPPIIDGELSEWNSLPYAVGPLAETASASAQFAVTFDEQFVYVAAKVKDARLVIQPGKPSSEQDGIEVWLDARGDPMRSESKAQADGFQNTFLFIRISPSLSGTAMDSTPPNPRSTLPKDLRTACRLTNDGYAAEVAIPLEYLNRMQGGHWRRFRLNLHVTDFVSASEPKLDVWWKPAWRTMKSSAGSGTFERN